MEFNDYKKSFARRAVSLGFPKDEISRLLSYAERLHKQHLPIIYDQEHLSRLVGFQLPYLLAMANSPKHFYNTYRILKQNGDYRRIDQPLPNLKLVQKWILDQILVPASEWMVSSVATAFIPGKSLREHVARHQGKKTVIALDLKDFFGSVKFYNIHDVYSQLGYSNSVSMLLARLTSYRQSLPQGAPTSPMLSNMVFLRIDNFLNGYCARRNIVYSRYADDMTFSGDDINIGLLLRHVRYLISGKYTLNEEKTKIMGQGNSQYVTGIVVNHTAQAPRAYREKIRQEMFYIQKYGLDFHISRVKGLKPWIKKPDVYLNHLKGKVNFVLQINPKDTEFVKYRTILNGIQTANYNK